MGELRGFRAGMIRASGWGRRSRNACARLTGARPLGRPIMGVQTKRGCRVPAISEWSFARADEAASLAGLVNDAYRATGPVKGWTSEAHLLGGQRIDGDMLREMLARDDSLILQAHVAGALCGCIHLEKAPPAGVELGLFAIRPDLQGRGLGRSVIAHAEHWAAAHWGARHAEITVIDLRRDLVAWYQRMGYDFTGERRVFPYGDERFGVAKRSDLAFAVMRKVLPGATAP